MYQYPMQMQQQYPMQMQQQYPMQMQQQYPMQMQQQYPMQMQQQQSMAQNNSEEGSFSIWHPCGNGDNIFLPHPVMTMVARLAIRNCLWIVLGIIALIFIIRYLIHPCYGECKSNVLMKGIDQIPWVGNIAVKVICFFSCFYINMFTNVLKISSSVFGL